MPIVGFRGPEMLIFIHHGERWEIIHPTKRPAEAISTCTKEDGNQDKAPKTQLKPPLCGHD